MSGEGWRTGRRRPGGEGDHRPRSSIAVASHDSVDSAEGGAAIVDAAMEVVRTAGRRGEQRRHLRHASLRRADGGQLAPDAQRAPRRQLLPDQPAYRIMKAQGGGRFVFIASSAGLFGQPNSAHYAAAKAGIVGLANVIAIDGAPHGILANTVLPFGYSRMVTETVGDREELGTPCRSSAIEPELVVPMVVYLASRACTLTHQNYSACAGRFARVFVGLGDGWVASPDTPPTAEAIEAHLAEVSATEPFTVPGSIFDEVTCRSARGSGFLSRNGLRLGHLNPAAGLPRPAICEEPNIRSTLAR